MVKKGIQLLAFGVFLLGLLLAVLLGTVSWWLPPLAGEILPRWGVTLEDSRRGPGGSWVLEQVHYGQPGDAVAVRVERISLPDPLRWAWAGWREKADTLEAIRVEGLDLHGKSVPAGESGRPLAEDSEPPGPGELLPEVAGALRAAERWLPTLRGSRWRVFPAEGADPLVFPELAWEEAALTARLSSFRGWPAARLHLQLPAGGPWDLRVTASAWKGEVRAEFDPDPHVPSLRGSLRLGAGKGTFAGSWSAGDWIPERAEATLDKIQLPEPLPLDNLPGAVRALRLEHAEVRWEGEGYRADLRLAGTPAGERLQAEVSVAGTGGELTVRQLRVEAEWAQVKLDHPVRLDLARLEAESPFRLSGSADLGRQDYLDASGSLRFALTAQPQGDPLLPVQFSAKGKDLAYDSLPLGTLSLKGRWEYPRVEVGQLELEAPAKSHLRLQGSADVSAQSLDLQGEADLQPEDLRAWLGNAPGLTGAVQVSLQASGPWKEPRHKGSVRTRGFQLAPLAPLDLSLQWRGQGIRELAASAQGEAPGDTLTVAVDSVSVEEGKPWQVRVASAEWTRQGKDFLRLQDPFRVHLDPAAQADWPWKGLLVETFALAGEGRSLAAYWNPPAEALVQAGGLRAASFAGWLATGDALPAVEVGEFSLRVHDFLPLLKAETAGEVSWLPPGESQSLRAGWQAVADTEGIRIGDLRVDYGDLSLLTGKGTLPLLLATGSLDHPYGHGSAPRGGGDPEEARLEGSAPGPIPLLRLLPGEKVNLSLQNQWGPQASQWLQQATGVDLGDLALDLRVEGTLESPAATLSLHAEQLQWPETWADGQLPRLRRIDLSLSADSDRISLTQAEVELRDSLLQGQASLPYESVYPWLEGKTPQPGEWLGKLTAEVRLKDWTAQNWQGRLPKVFRSTGTLTGTVRLKEGLQLGGELRARNFGLRPTAATSAIDAIDADLRLDGRRVILEKMTGSTGGGDLELTGSLDTTDPDDPSYQLRLRGKDVPVARTPSLVIRSDLDLKLDDPGGEGPARLTGKLDFQNSTFLLEIDPFAPNVRGGPSARPPYFSVEAQPFADWELEVRLTGEDFLRVRSSVLSTSLSANLRLEGTLGEPLLLGSVRTEEGTLRFPGMNLRIESAEAFLLPQSPHTLLLEASGIGRSQSTIVTMNVTGSAQSPQVTFGSTPSLSNAEILRVLTTGSTQGGGGAQALGLYLGRIFAGVDGGSDRLTVELGEDVSENGRSTLEVLYRLNRRWSLQGEYDIYDNYNLNLRRLLYEK
jgi:translocation and assembly module TamB